MVQLYGKLPLAKDYLRIGCSRGLAGALREWMDEAFSAGLGQDEAPEPGWPMHFVLAERGVALQGALWPSTDAAGLRRFPFALAIERHRRALGRDLAAGLPAAEAAWRRLEELRTRADGQPDGRAFLAWAQGQRIEVPTPEPVQRDPVDALEWIEAIWPDGASQGLLALFARLRELTASGFRGPLRLPLVADRSPLVQALAWWKLLTAAGCVRAEEPRTLFFPQGGGELDATFALLLDGLPRASDASWFQSRGSAPLGPGDLTPPGTPRAGPRAAASGQPLAEGLLNAWRA